MNLSLIFTLLFLCSPFVNSFKCQLCIEATQKLQSTLIKLTPEQLVKSAVQLVCQKKYDSQKLCEHVSDQLTPLAIKSGIKGLLKQGRICELFCGNKFYQSLDINDIEKSLENLNGLIQKNWKPTYDKIVLKSQQMKKLRILHLTDVHLDLNYTQKSSTVCSMPVCCHLQNGFPEKQQIQAKPYGSSRCDLPIKLLDKALDYIEQNIHQVDIVIVTGDYSAHNEWQKTPQTVKYVRNLVEQKIKQKMKAQYIFTAPGNNQYLPDHQVDPSSVSEESIKVLRVYQPDQQNYITLVSINTLFCDMMNLYLIQDQTGSIRQLKMLEKILQQNQNIYLLGHISLTSQSCSNTYSLVFRTILNKYKEKILGQFYGHTHLDQFVVNSNPKNIQQITSFGMLAGSLSPLGTGTSRFRIYELNQSSLKLQNYLDYQLKIEQESFGLNYEFKQYYQIQDSEITPQSMRKLQVKLQSDQKLRKKYANQLSGKQSGNLKAYCQTYDDKQKISKCLQNQLTLTMQINKYLELIQGPWGSYGEMIQ